VNLAGMATLSALGKTRGVGVSGNTAERAGRVSKNGTITAACRGPLLVPRKRGPS
jgi:hypothetical protein